MAGNSTMTGGPCGAGGRVDGHPSTAAHGAAAGGRANAASLELLPRDDGFTQTAPSGSAFASLFAGPAAYRSLVLLMSAKDCMLDAESWFEMKHSLALFGRLAITGAAATAATAIYEYSSWPWSTSKGKRKRT